MSAKSKIRLTPEILRGLVGQIRSGYLGQIEIRQTAKGRRWTVKYTISKHSYASAANFQARQEWAQMFIRLADDLEHKRIKSMYVHLTDPTTYNLSFAITIEEPTAAELRELEEDAADA